MGALCVFDARPARLERRGRRLLEQLAASVVTELELHALDAEVEADRLLWELAIAAAGIGTFDWDLVSGALTWDDQLIDAVRLRPDDVRPHHRGLQRPACTRTTCRA